ncbi:MULTISPECIES: restriction endonuclease [Aliarcobacter]|uniref:restriction endonuclease n=1 Tax=Aliarcobacter TaxID=2321111 RepID=UPI00100B2248|nr:MULTISPECIES: restriction endonuclease [Aliarcobacter]RXI26093.1 restriction endonuclease [Aliarcobacter trophiarum]
MNEFMLNSLELSKNNYLDLLLDIYPMEEEPRRSIPDHKKVEINCFCNSRDKLSLILTLLDLELFPIKDSYIAFLKRSNDPERVLRNNPITIDRLGDRLLSMGYNEIIEECSKPKETNRKIGPMFKNWVQRLSSRYYITTDQNEILNSENGIIILNTSDDDMKKFARNYLGYTSDKGLDFIAKKDNNYIVGETKFLTDFGGHQNAQLNDAMAIFNNNFNNNVTPIAILDGVVWIEGKNYQYNTLLSNRDKFIFSALYLPYFLDRI